jgi:phosphohistidine phosphatase SixA
MNRNLLRSLFLFTIVLGSANLRAQNTNVKVIDFTVSAKEQKVIIDWKTDGTRATNYFAIQKSTDGVNFKTIALILGPDPKKANLDCYGCTDKYIKNAKSYYRVVHIDNDGREQITEAKVLATP